MCDRMGAESILSRRTVGESCYKRRRRSVGRVPGAAGVAGDLVLTGSRDPAGIVGERAVCRDEFHEFRLVSDRVDGRVHRLSAGVF